MNYQEFFNDIANWILQVNDNAMKYTMESETFWNWVTESIGQLSDKYGNSQLVVRQMSMLYLWLEDVYASTQK